MYRFRMRRTCIGIELARHELRLVALASGSRDTVVLAEGLHRQTAVTWELTLRDPAFEDWLRQLVKSHRLRGAQVVVGVPNDRVLVRYTRMPALPDKALRQAVELELGNSIHVPFDEPVFDVVPVTAIDDNSENPKTQSVCLVVTGRGVVDSVLSPLRHAGLRPLAVEVSPLALWRLVRPNDYRDELTVLVQLDEGQMTISIFWSDAMYFFRTTDGALVESVDRGMGVTFAANDIGYEIERVVNFFNFNLANHERPLGTVWLQCDDAGEDLAGALSERLQREVRLVTAHGWLSGADKLHPRLNGAVGLALRGITS